MHGQMQGHLLKQMQDRRWKKRFFMLSGKTLHQSAAEAQAATATLNITSVRRVASPENPKPFVISATGHMPGVQGLLPHDKTVTWNLAAADESSLAQWCDTLAAVGVSVAGSTLPTPVGLCTERELRMQLQEEAGRPVLAMQMDIALQACMSAGGSSGSSGNGANDIDATAFRDYGFDKYVTGMPHRRFYKGQPVTIESTDGANTAVLGRLYSSSCCRVD
jgi:hypothetical protein